MLDEATSALDDATEKSVTDTILKFKGKLTIIAVAHRLSTLAECDFKVCFDDGKATILNRNIERKGQNDVYGTALECIGTNALPRGTL